MLSRQNFRLFLILMIFLVLLFVWTSQRPRKDHGCDPILALAQRTLLVPMLYLLMEVLRIGARLCMKVDALDDLCIL